MSHIASPPRNGTPVTAARNNPGWGFGGAAALPRSESSSMVRGNAARQDEESQTSWGFGGAAALPRSESSSMVRGNAARQDEESQTRWGFGGAAALPEASLRQWFAATPRGRTRSRKRGGGSGERPRSPKRVFVNGSRQRREAGRRVANELGVRGSGRAPRSESSSMVRGNAARQDEESQTSERSG